MPQLPIDDDEYDRQLRQRDPFAVPPSRLGVPGVPSVRGGAAMFPNNAVNPLQGVGNALGLLVPPPEAMQRGYLSALAGIEIPEGAEIIPMDSGGYMLRLRDGRLVDPAGRQGRDVRDYAATTRRSTVLPLSETEGAIAPAVPGLLDAFPALSGGPAGTLGAGVTRGPRRPRAPRAAAAGEVAELADDAPLPPRSHNNPPPGELIPDDVFTPGPRPPADPSFVGVAPDRSGFNIERYAPARGVSPRLDSALEALQANRGGVLDQMRQDIRHGLSIQAGDWYNTEEMRSWFIRSLGSEQAGDAAWRDFVRKIGATSTGSKVPANIRNASFYFNQGDDRLRENAAALSDPDNPLLPDAGFGHKMQRNHALNVARDVTGAWDARIANLTPLEKQLLNEKPLGFMAGLLGNRRNIAADLHWTRYMGLASRDSRWLDNGAEVSEEFVQRLRQQYPDEADRYITTRNTKQGPVTVFRARRFVEDGGEDAAARTRRFDVVADEPTVYVGIPNANEYGAMERFANELGREFSLTGPQLQAALWMGAAQRTGLADESQGTFMELLRRQIQRRAGERKISPSQVWDDFANRRPGGTLLVPGLLGGGGAAAYAGGEQQ